MFEGILQPTHLILILVIALVVFGPGKLPEMGSALGKSIKEFRHSVKDITDAVSLEATADEAPNPAASAKPVQSVKAAEPVKAVEPAKAAESDSHA
jgi:sec-independent protein translocase protein TatA